MDQRNTVIHEVLRMVFAIPVTEGSQGGDHLGCDPAEYRKRK
jgi:hypothetical protein